MKLVWDSDQYVATINEVKIHIAAEQCPLPEVTAKIEEQDTSLILEPSDTINEYNDDKPVWYLSNTQAIQETHPTGSVIIKPGMPIRLLAVVHDLDCTPSWHEEWVFEALEKSFNILNDKQMTSVAVPCFGRHFKDFELENFTRPLVKVLQNSNNHYPKKIWLIAPVKQCPLLHDSIKFFLSR